MILSEKTNATRQAIRQLLGTSRTHLVTTHRDPDMDAVGSLMGWMGVLKGAGVEVEGWMAEGFPMWLHLLPGVDEIQTQIPRNQYDMIWVLDCAGLNRVAQWESLQGVKGVVLNVDHHMDNTGFGDHVLTEPVSSVGELLTGLAREWSLGVSPTTATWWMGAIVADTGRFLFSNTTSHTLAAMHWLCEQGGDMGMVTHFLDESLTVDGLEALRQALNGVSLDESGRMAMVVLPPGMDEGVAVIRVLRQVKSIEVMAVFRRLPSGGVRVNLRSKHQVAVNQIAHAWGGGGHARAAGVTLDLPMNDAVAVVRQALSAALP